MHQPSSLSTSLEAVTPGGQDQSHLYSHVCAMKGCVKRWKGAGQIKPSLLGLPCHHKFWKCPPKSGSQARAPSDRWARRSWEETDRQALAIQSQASQTCALPPEQSGLEAQGPSPDLGSPACLTWAKTQPQGPGNHLPTSARHTWT